MLARKMRCFSHDTWKKINNETETDTETDAETVL
jgi:hypothetical protein